MTASGELDYLTATELVGLLAARKVSSVELLERAITRPGHLIVRRDGVDVGCRGRKRDSHTGQPRARGQRLEQPHDTSFVALVHDVVERLEPLTCFDRFQRRGFRW